MIDSRTMRSILDSMAEAVVVSDVNFKLIYFNKSAEHLHGVGLSDIPPEGWGERYGIFFSDAVTPCPPEQIPLVRVLRGEMPENVELYVKRPDGSGSMVEVTGRPLLDLDGKTLGGVVVFADITKRKRIEDILHKSEAALKEAQRLAHVGSWERDLTTGEAIWSEEIYRILGLDPSSPPISLKDQSRLFTPESYAQLSAAVAKAAQDGTSYELDLELLRPDHTLRWIVARGEAVRNSAGKIIGLRGTAMDITDRKRIETALHKSEGYLHAVLDHMPAMIAYWNADLLNEFGNAAYEEWFGITPEQMRGCHIREVIGEERYTLNEPYIQGALRGEPQLFERAIKDIRGVDRYTQASYVPDVSYGKVKGFFVLVTDITQRRQVELALQEGEDRFRDMAANMPGIVYQFVHYPDGRAYYPYVSSKIKDVLGIEPEALMADPSQWFDLIHPDDRKNYFAKLQEASQELTYRNWEGRLLLRDGSVKWVNSSATPRALPEGGVLWNGLILDITERKAMELELERQAQIDYLTGVANRGYFLKMAEQELARIHRYGGSLSIAMIDLDHFKTINDTYGHRVGDIALKELTKICHRVLRGIDIVGRIGGEEFAVLLPETDGARAFEAIERLRKAIDDSAVLLEHGLPLRFTASIGIAYFSSKTDTNIDILLDRADHALYKAKQSGRNKVCSQ